MKNPGQWISAFVAIVVAVFTMAAYAHSTFMTVREKQDITSRLDRIEKKVDRILEGINPSK